MVDVSFLIPARNEMFLARTVQDLLENTEGEILVGLDGCEDETVPKDPRVIVIKFSESIGQRAITNRLASIAEGKYVCKVDAHCAFDKGWDKKMLEAFKQSGDDVTMVSTMRNLWAFDWKCMKCGKRWYQGPTPTICKETACKQTGGQCDGQDFRRKMVWKGKERPESNSYCFDSTPHFQYFNQYTKRPEWGKTPCGKRASLVETMSLQGSCFMLTKDNYWKWEVCDEKAGSWGNQGIEVACATWLSGGRVLVNRDTWYAHMFRTQGGDFSFPYEQSGRAVEKTKSYIVDKFWNMKHPTQIYNVKWLVEKFAPVPGWSEEDINKLNG